jgi:predicted metal-binding protein
VPSTVTVCVTCRREDAPDEVVSGVEMKTYLEDELSRRPALSGVRVIEQRCLMACKRGCVVALRAPGKMAYVVGDFAPEQEAVTAIADYLEQYQQSADGVVRFAFWPQGIKGHFVARLPPPAED